MTANVLVVVIDGLRASALGAYGNTTSSTPALDQFAAESLLFDWCYGTSLELPAIYWALWNSSAQLDRASQASRSLPGLFAQHGYLTSFITDEPELAGLAAAAGFQQINQHSYEAPSPSIHGTIADTLQTKIATLLTACSQKLRDDSIGNERTQFIWLHSRGMYADWDAPIDLQQSLLDESDPPPLDGLKAPDCEITADDDPDLVFRYSCAYAAQIMALDICWEHTLARFLDRNASEWLVMLIGARGFPLGEHKRIGGVDSRMHAEQLHVPWLIRFPDGHGRLARANRLTVHSDVLPTLLEWLSPENEAVDRVFEGRSVLSLSSRDSPSWRNAIVSKSTTSRSVRTDTWCLREDLGASDSPELYVRPDDRWEANDIAKLCPREVDELRAM